MKFVDYKCLESLLIEGEEMIATEALFDKFKKKNNLVKAEAPKAQKENEPLKKIDSKLLKHAVYNNPFYPYNNGELSSEEEKLYKQLLIKVKSSITCGATLIRSIGKKHIDEKLEDFIQNSFEEFQNTNDWKTIGNYIKQIQDIEANHGGIELDTIEVLDSWSLINTEHYLDADLYDFKVSSCSQDNFFIFDNIIAYLLDNLCKNIPNAFGNCFADDSAVYTVIITK